MRAMSWRTSRNARRVRKLPGRSLEAQVELLFLELDEFIVQLVWRPSP